MKNKQSDNDKKLFYSITEVARLVQVNVPTLRYWEKEFPSFAPRRTEGGTRKYTQADIETLKQIIYLVKEKRMTIEGAKQQLTRQPKVVDRNTQILNRLKQIRQELVALKEALP